MEFNQCEGGQPGNKQYATSFPDLLKGVGSELMKGVQPQRNDKINQKLF